MKLLLVSLVRTAQRELKQTIRIRFRCTTLRTGTIATGRIAAAAAAMAHSDQHLICIVHHPPTWNGFQRRHEANSAVFRFARGIVQDFGLVLLALARFQRYDALGSVGSRLKKTRARRCCCQSSAHGRWKHSDTTGRSCCKSRTLPSRGSSGSSTARRDHASCVLWSLKALTVQ
jgi:hypothetical protein